jgi:hypothetical protein
MTTSRFLGVNFAVVFSKSAVNRRGVYSVSCISRTRLYKLESHRHWEFRLVLAHVGGCPRIQHKVRINMSTANTASSDAVSMAPLAHWGDHQNPAHVVQLYGDDGFLLDDLSRFIGTALGAGEAALVIATKEHRDGLARRLKMWGLDTTWAVAQGRCQRDSGENHAK